MNTPGTITSGTVAINAGTVGGKAASGAAAVANPVQIGGTDSGGTIYSPLITIAGAGTISGVGTVPGIGVLTTLTNLSNGTIQNSGTTTGVGVVTSVTGIASGTIQNSGTVTGVGVVSNLTNGSVVVTAGTISSGTINAGTVRTQPEPASQVLSANVSGTLGIGTLVSAIGAGTGIYVQSIALDVGSGTLDLCLSFGTQITGAQVGNRGAYTTYGGIAQSFPQASFFGTSNSPLTYQILGGAGTAYWNVTYSTKGTP